MTGSVFRREQGRRAPRSGVGVRRAGAGGLRLAGAEPGGSDIGPGVAVRACRAYHGRGGERKRGVHLRSSQRQRPFLIVSDASGVAVSIRQQALGPGIVFGARDRSSR